MVLKTGTLVKSLQLFYKGISIYLLKFGIFLFRNSTTSYLIIVNNKTKTGR